MSTQGRRGGTRRKSRSEAAAAAAPTPAIEPTVETTVPPVAAHLDEVAQLLDERTVAIDGGRRGLSLGRSLPGAIIGTLLVVGIAFGASGPGGALGPKATDGKDAAAAADTTTAFGGGSAGQGGYEDDKDGYEGDHEPDPTKNADEAGGDEPDATPKPDEDVEVNPTTKPEPDATRKPEPDATRKPQPDATKKPAQDPEPAKDPTEPIGLELAIKEKHPAVFWGSCEGLGLDYYKVVRSTDSTVSWPTGKGDEMVAAVEQGGYRKAWDKAAPHGVKVWYRVFCVRKTNDGYKVVNASVTRGIFVPEETPPPDPISFGLEADVTGEGKVVLTWGACEVAGFAFYKVVRSEWNANPSYLPWTDGSEVIGVVAEMHDTEWHDWAPDSGETAWYRVQCIGYHDGQKVLLGQSAAVAVTMP